MNEVEVFVHDPCVRAQMDSFASALRWVLNEKTIIKKLQEGKQQISVLEIKFTVQVSDETSGIDRVEFTIDGQLQYNDANTLRMDMDRLWGLYSDCNSIRLSR